MKSRRRSAERRTFLAPLQVLRTSQYGCNCRGMGGNGGCGEFDIVEAVIGNNHSDMLFTTVYDFKGTGAPGTDKYFLRPSVRIRNVVACCTPYRKWAPQLEPARQLWRGFLLHCMYQAAPRKEMFTALSSSTHSPSTAARRLPRRKSHVFDSAPTPSRPPHA